MASPFHLIIEEVRQDARHALRLWLSRPATIGFAILALAVGIGANTGVFSVINALLLRSLPFQSRWHRFIPILCLMTALMDSAIGNDEVPILAGAALFEQTDANLGNTDNIVRAHAAQTAWNFSRCSEHNR